jgi:hypothetical protein
MYSSSDEGLRQPDRKFDSAGALTRDSTSFSDEAGLLESRHGMHAWKTACHRLYSNAYLEKSWCVFVVQQIALYRCWTSVEDSKVSWTFKGFEEAKNLLTKSMDSKDCLPAEVPASLMTAVSISIPSATSTITSSRKGSAASKLRTTIDKNIAVFEGVPLELIETATQRIAILLHIGSRVPVSAGLTIQLIKPVIGEVVTYWLPV